MRVPQMERRLTHDAPPPPLDRQDTGVQCEFAAPGQSGAAICRPGAQVTVRRPHHHQHLHGAAGRQDARGESRTVQDVGKELSVVP